MVSVIERAQFMLPNMLQVKSRSIKLAIVIILKSILNKRREEVITVHIEHFKQLLLQLKIGQVHYLMIVVLVLAIKQIMLRGEAGTHF